MSNDKMNVLNLNGIDVHDYYYPDWVGCGGFIFRYKAQNQDFLMFSLPSCYLEDAFKILIYLELDVTSDIVGKYIEGGGMIVDDEILDNPWIIKDKEILINNLKCITEDNIIEWSNITSNSVYMFDLYERKLLLEMINNLILFLSQSEDNYIELIYI